MIPLENYLLQILVLGLMYVRWRMGMWIRQRSTKPGLRRCNGIAEDAEKTNSLDGSNGSGMSGFIVGVIGKLGGKAGRMKISNRYGDFYHTGINKCAYCDTS